MKKMKFIILFILIIFYSCNLNKSNLKYNYSNSSSNLTFDEIKKRFKYDYHFGNFIFESYGNFNKNGNLIFLNSDFKDSIVSLFVKEDFLINRNGFTFCLDSNFNNNLSICSIIINNNKSLIFSCNSLNNIIHIYDSSLINIECFQFFFAHGFKSNLYNVKNSNSNVFLIKSDMPKDIEWFEIFDNKRVVIKRNRLQIEKEIFR